MEVQEVAKDYAIVDGEKIYFDEPFEEVPDKADFEDWLHRNGNRMRWEMNRGDQGAFDETVTQPEYRVSKYQRSATRRY